MNLSKRVGLNINRRQNSSVKKYNSSLAVADQGRGPGSPLIFRSNWGSKGRKNFVLSPGPPRYLRVWIRHWLASFSFLDAVILPALYSFFCRQWNIRNCRSNFRDIFHFLPREKLQEKLWFVAFLVGVLRRNSQSEGAECCKAPKKGRNFGTKLEKFCGFWLEVSHEKKQLSRFWLDV